jgi:hypothetical protein
VSLRTTFTILHKEVSGAILQASRGTVRHPILILLPFLYIFARLHDNLYNLQFYNLQISERPRTAFTQFPGICTKSSLFLKYNNRHQFERLIQSEFFHHKLPTFGHITPRFSFGAVHILHSPSTRKTAASPPYRGSTQTIAIYIERENPTQTIISNIPTASSLQAWT